MASKFEAIYYDENRIPKTVGGISSVSNGKQENGKTTETMLPNEAPIQSSTADGQVGNSEKRVKPGLPDLPSETKPTEQQTQTPATQTPTVAQSYIYDASSDKAYMEAIAALQKARENMPTYTPSYDAQLDDLYHEIVGREDFKYDINSDALYQQYAEQYQNLGKMAMQDTMGKAAAMTGGYGNSYAATAGNQAYQAYLSELNSVVPELYGMAYDRYAAEGEEMLNQYGMLRDMADDEYSKYLAELDNYWKEVSYLDEKANEEYERGRDNFYIAKDYEAAEAERKAEQEAYYQQLLSNIGKNPDGNDVETDANPNTYFESIRDTAANIENEGELDDYLTQQYEQGRITEDEIIQIYEEYDLSHPDAQKPIAEREYTMTDDGGVNWFWGIDRNAKVTDHYGNEYTMKELYDELKKAMTNKEAREYVKALQKELGITK